MKIIDFLNSQPKSNCKTRLIHMLYTSYNVDATILKKNINSITVYDLRQIALHKGIGRRCFKYLMNNIKMYLDSNIRDYNGEYIRE